MQRPVFREMVHMQYFCCSFVYGSGGQIYSPATVTISEPITLIQSTVPQSCGTVDGFKNTHAYMDCSNSYCNFRGSKWFICASILR